MSEPKGPVEISTPEDRTKTRAAIKDLHDKLRRQEAQTVSGAGIRLPRGAMLDLKGIKDMHPDKHYRYVNMTDPEKVKTRRDQGYVPVSDKDAEEAGVSARHGNELVLMEVPRAVAEQRVESLKRLNEQRLKAHKAEVSQVVESVVRELRDKHGLDVSMERLLVKDER